MPFSTKSLLFIGVLVTSFECVLTTTFEHFSLFQLMLYVQVNNFSVTTGHFSKLNQYLAVRRKTKVSWQVVQRHNTVHLMRLEPGTSQSHATHFITEPLHSFYVLCTQNNFCMSGDKKYTRPLVNTSEI